MKEKEMTLKEAPRRSMKCQALGLAYIEKYGTTSSEIYVIKNFIIN